jgi:hypothetical protein
MESVAFKVDDVLRLSHPNNSYEASWVFRVIGHRDGKLVVVRIDMGASHSAELIDEDLLKR